MEDHNKNQASSRKGLHWFLTLLVCLVILAAASAITYYIYTTEPATERTTATRETAMLVEVVSVERGNYRPQIVEQGQVEPAKDIILSPRVSGEIVERSTRFRPGQLVEQGAVLLQIDPADYQNILAQRQSDLQQARADLEIERGLQDVAQQEYDLLQETLPQEDRSLVLRQPQLNSVEAAIQSAETAVRQARLELERTTIRAPFDAQIITRNVNIGSQVAAGDNLARLVGVDEYWVVTTVPISKLQWIEMAGDDKPRGSPARVRNETAWPEGVTRQGYVDRLIGALDQQTRMARILVTIPDPLSLQDDRNGPPLIIGEYMRVIIEGRELRDVIRLNRNYVHEGDTVWVMEAGTLQIREVSIPFRDAQYAYIRDGLNESDKVVTTNLTTVVEGAPLRTQAMPEGETNP